jgi:hypothetical protein
MTVPFLFQVVIIIPIDGQTTVRFFFQVVIMNRQNIRARGTPPTIPTDGQTTEPSFSGRNYAPAKQLYLIYFQVIIIIPTKGQMTVCFLFQVVIMNPPKHPSSWKPPQTFPLTARRLSLFFPDVIMNPPDD